jgi:MYXO-CTERM domain-containing protein
LRVGIHVQGFADGGSEAFINDPPVVPLPGAALLGVLGLGTAGGLCRRRRASRV